MPRRRRFFSFLRFLALGVLAAAVLAPPAALLRARRLPAVEVPVLRYGRLAVDAPDARTTSLADFFTQLEDLRLGAFESVTPARLRQYVRWGRALPPRPILLAIDEATPALTAAGLPELAGGFAPTRLPGSVEDILRAFDFTAVVVDAPSDDPAAGRIGTAEAKAAARRGALSFLEGSGIGLSDAEGVARIGPGVDLSALPTLRVAGGDHLFAARCSQDSLVPETFGTLRLEHVSGEALPLALLVYSSDLFPPFAQKDAGVVPAGGTVELPLAADVKFPIEVVVYDPERLVLRYRQTIPRNDVTRPAGWHAPIAGPEEGVPLDPL